MTVIARMTIRRALLLVFYQCLRNALLYAERSAKWLPTFAICFVTSFESSSVFFAFTIL